MSVMHRMIAGGGKDIGSVVVAQVVHGCEPQRERPELLHQGDEQQVRCSLIQDDDREQGDLGAADDSRAECFMEL